MVNIPENPNREGVAKTAKEIEDREYDECVECGIPIAKGLYMCDECYWTLREG